MISNLSDLELGAVQWQGVQEYTTQRGRVKPVLVGIPGSVFWHHWKHRPEFKQRLKEVMLSPQRVAKGQWQLVLWINARNRHLAESAGFVVPEIAAIETKSNPF